MNDHDPIDGLLEELIGGQAPPDLTARILGAHDASTDSWVDVQRGKSPPSNGNHRNSPKELPKVVPVANSPVVTAAKRARRRKTQQLYASAAAVLVAASLFSAWALNLKDSLNLANTPPPINEPLVPQGQTPKVAVPDENSQQPQKMSNAPSKPKSREGTPPIDSPGVVDEPLPPAPPVVQVVSPVFRRSVELGLPGSDQRIVSFINRRLREKWEEESISPMDSVSDSIWFRRASLILRGHDPSKQESQRFGRRPNRKDAIDAMLASDAFVQHWSNVITNVLVGNRAKQQGSRRQLQDYIATSIRKNKPHDQLAFELISAVGSNDRNSPQFNAATNFLLAHQGVGKVNGKRAPELKLAATDKVCQIFLGKQVQCAHCHDHNGTTQQQFYQVAAFFAQMRPLTENNTKKLVNVDFVGSADTPDEADLFFEADGGLGVSVYPKFLDGQTATTTSGKIQDIDRRAELAQMVVSSDDFSTATINRLWRHVVGTGFINHMDDMGDTNNATHPELLARLATEFRNSKYDIKAALKWMTLSSAFDRVERRPASRDDLFASFAGLDHTMYLAIAPELRRIGKARAAGQFGDEILAQQGTNGKPISPKRKAAEMQRIAGRFQRKLLKTNAGSLLARIAANEDLDDRQRVAHLFWATVGRAPRRNEMNHGLQMLKHGSPTTAMQDVGWILLNSKEFVTGH